MRRSPCSRSRRTADDPAGAVLDRIVNGEDLVNWAYFRALSGGKSSGYDFAIDGAYDGLTDERDLAVIRQNRGRIA